jgi:hypothetical protein
MKRITILTILLLITSLQFSCKKETIVYATTADEITKELQKVITENAITRIIAWDDKGGFPPVSPTLGLFWTFSNGFITIGGYGGEGAKFSWNLLYLDTYDVSKVLLTDGTNPPALVLHFKS